MSYVNNKKKVTKNTIATFVLQQRYQKIATSIFNQIEHVNWKSEVWKSTITNITLRRQNQKNLLIIVKNYYISVLV